MKKLSILFLCMAVTLSVSAQRTKTIVAEGQIVTQERTATNFNGIDASSAINVYLTQGNDFSISVEAQENLHEYIRTEVQDNVLKVYTKVNIKKHKPMNVYVTMKEVKVLKCSSAGDIIGKDVIKANEIDLETSSAGDIDIEVTAKKIMVDCSSAGDIHLVGKADYLRASVSSAGDLKAIDLVVNEADVSASSAGSIYVNVTDRLNATSSSTGDIRYTGNPEVQKRTSSLGSVKKK